MERVKYNKVEVCHGDSRKNFQYMKKISCQIGQEQL